MNLFTYNLKQLGLSPVVNVRIRGKIRHEEWPKIVARYRGGESLTEIARSYHCTAPAIRYIVNRSSARTTKGRRMERDTANGAGELPTRVSSLTSGHAKGPTALQKTELWSRMNSDIASYLAEMDVLAADDSDANYEMLLAATDKLLRATARTRLELERLLASRKKTGQTRRLTG